MAEKEVIVTDENGAECEWKVVTDENGKFFKCFWKGKEGTYKTVIPDEVVDLSKMEEDAANPPAPDPTKGPKIYYRCYPVRNSNGVIIGYSCLGTGNAGC